MAKAISYKRVSLGRQVTGDGLGRQDDAARAYCERTGNQLDEKFVDAGVSACRGRNAAIGRLGRMMEFAEAGTWEHGTKLLVEHFDRLSRNKITEARQRAERILKAGIAIVTLADGQGYTWERINDDLGAIIVMTVMMFKSHEESKLKGDRVAKTKAIRRAARPQRRSQVNPSDPALDRNSRRGQELRFLTQDQTDKSHPPDVRGRHCGHGQAADYHSPQCQEGSATKGRQRLASQHGRSASS